MKKSALLLLCCALLVGGCVRPQDNTPSKFQRQANIKKYVQKAKAWQQRGKQRQKPLTVPALADVSLVSNTPVPPDFDFLTRLLERNRQVIAHRLQQTYAQDSAAKLSSLGNHYLSLAVTAAQQAPSPSALAESLRQIQQEQNKAWEDFIAAQNGTTRLKPAQNLLDGARKRIENRNKEFLDKIAFYYGQKAADQCRPALAKALDNFVQAMQEAETEQDLSARLQQIRQQTVQDVNAVLAQDSDPLGVTPQAVIAQIRSGSILAQQQLETDIEFLYGKDAVLQARKAFNRTWSEMESALQENARLSRKKAVLERLNDFYRQEILASQKRWNGKAQRHMANGEYLSSARP